MEYRKLQVTSDGSYFVTIPKYWILNCNLKKGDMLKFKETINGTLSLSSETPTEKTLKTTSLMPSPYLERIIGESYLSGTDIIKITSKKFLSSEIRERAKKTLKRFVGLEIIEEDSKNLVIQCLLEPSLIIPDKITRRIHAISSEMEKDSVTSLLQDNKELANTVIERDEEVDRQYFLLVRLVRTALTYPNIAEKLSISPLECLDYRLLASLIEHYADYSVDIAMSTLKVEPKSLPKIFKDNLNDLSRQLYNEYNNSFISVLKNDIELALKVSNFSTEIKDNLNSIQSSILKTQFPNHKILANIFIALNSMCEICIDISDLTKAK
jgi:phosphate uptake regulator